jgi:hypothetical protein
MADTIPYLPDAEVFERLAKPVTTNTIMFFIFAFVEPVMARWFENRVTARQAPHHEVPDSE